MRAAFLSDVHSNLEALDAVLEHAREQGAVAYVVLGDIVGYNADPDGVIARLMSLPNLTLLAGNHDLAVTGRFDVGIFNRIAADAISWTGEVLSPEARGVLEGLEPRAEATQGLLVHGSVVDPAIEYVVNTDVARRSFDAEDFALCFFGHTHVPTCFSANGGEVNGTILQDGVAQPLGEGARFMLNPGSVGQPRDGDPRASYMIYDDAERVVVVHRVTYDLERTQRKVLDAGLHPFLAERLASGR